MNSLNSRRSWLLAVNSSSSKRKISNWRRLPLSVWRRMLISTKINPRSCSISWGRCQSISRRRIISSWMTNLSRRWSCLRTSRRAKSNINRKLRLTGRLRISWRPLRRNFKSGRIHWGKLPSSSTMRRLSRMLRTTVMRSWSTESRFRVLSRRATKCLRHWSSWVLRIVFSGRWLVFPMTTNSNWMISCRRVSFRWRSIGLKWGRLRRKSRSWRRSELVYDVGWGRTRLVEKWATRMWRMLIRGRLPSRRSRTWSTDVSWWRRSCTTTRWMDMGRVLWRLRMELDSTRVEVVTIRI